MRALSLTSESLMADMVDLGVSQKIRICLDIESVLNSITVAAPYLSKALSLQIKCIYASLHAREPVVSIHQGHACRAHPHWHQPFSTFCSAFPL